MKWNKYYISFLAFLFMWMTTEVVAQTENVYKVSGVVVDDMGEVLPSATIRIGDSPKGVVSGIDGKFSLNLAESPVVLHFSFVGMKKKSVTVDRSSKTLRVQMQSATQLAEVVIEGGYGLSQKRSDMVGSAFQVESKKLESLPPGRVDNLLDGLVPGLTVQPNTDAPGSPRTRYNIRVRGEASLAASNEPLWIIDGVPVYQGSSTNMIPGTSYTVSPLSYINPSDIESITVLKDATATSIYGANGANGVIIVKTKAGIESEKVIINANVRYGISSVDQSTRYKVMNAAQYMTYAKEAWVNGGQNINEFPYQDNDLNSYSTTDVDWGDLYYGRGEVIDAGISLKGGTKVNKSYLSLSYFNEKGTVIGNEQQRFSVRFNNEYKFSDRLTFNAILTTSYNQNDIFALSHEYYEVLPIFSPYNQDGYSNRLYNRVVDDVEYDNAGNPVSYNWKDVKFFDNSIPDRDDNSNVQQTYMSEGAVSFKYKILNGLEFTEQFGISMKTTNEAVYSARTTLDGLVNDVPKGYSHRASATYLNWNNIARLNYNRTFGDFKVGALAGTEFQHNHYSTLYATGYGFLNDRIREISFSETTSRTGSSSISTKRLLSYLGQVNLSYNDRYFLAANVRADGSSYFEDYSRWGKFGSVGFSWNLNKEDFFDSEVVRLLKIKTSIGTNGNSRIDSFTETGTYTYSETYSYNGVLGAVSTSVANPGLSWEATTMFNVGIRTSLLDRIDVELEYYNNYTTDLLTKVYTSRTISDDRLYANVGEMRNQGVELTLNTTNIRKRNFEWDTDLIFAHNDNKITKLYNGVMTSFGSTVWAENHVKGAFYLVRWAGVDPATGAPMWYDKDGNITFAYSTDNRVILDESPEPWATGSMTNTFKYKNFSLRVMLNYMFGGYALSSMAMRGLQDGYDVTGSNADIDAVSRWSQPGDLAVNPRISTVTSKSSMSSTRYLYSQTNIRLQNVVLSYQIPDKLIKRIKLRSCSVSLIGDNLYLWTPDQSKEHNSYKTLKNGYPVERSFALSLLVGM